jgi:L-asparaginase
LVARGNRYLTPGESIIALDGSAYLLNDPDKGPLLMDYRGNEIFTFPLFSPTKFPGQLHMQEDGNLVFYDRDNQAVYATGTFEIGMRQSRLILGGSYTKGNLTLYVENRNVAIETHLIYKQG